MFPYNFPIQNLYNIYSFIYLLYIPKFFLNYIYRYKEYIYIYLPNTLAMIRDFLYHIHEPHPKSISFIFPSLITNSVGLISLCSTIVPF